jgi:hypothetical protein
MSWSGEVLKTDVYTDAGPLLLDGSGCRRLLLDALALTRLCSSA